MELKIENTRVLVPASSKRCTLRRLLLACILTGCGTLMLININQPWIGSFAPAGVKRSIEAKNYLRYGFLDLKFGLCRNYEPLADPRHCNFYQHHPPLTSILLVPSFAVFGISELSARVVFAIFTLCNVFLIFSLGKRACGKRIALTAAFIFAVMPVTTFYGKEPNYEPVTLLLILLSICLYIRWLTERTSKAFTIFLLVYAVGLFSDWPFYFLAGLLPIHYFLCKGRSSYRDIKIWLIPLLTVVVFGALLAYIVLVGDSYANSLLEQFRAHSGLGPPKVEGEVEAAHRFSIGLLFLKVLQRSIALFLYPVLALAVLGLFYLSVGSDWGKRRTEKMMLIMLWILPTAYCIVFYRSTFIHVQWLYYFSVPVSITAALGVEELFWKRSSLIDRLLNRDAIVTVVFVVALILAPGIWELRKLHKIQRKFLPGDQYESVTLMRNVAYQLRAFTEGSSTIFTNLALRRAGPMFAYYAERSVVGDVTTAEEVETQSKETRGPQYFFLWSGKEGGRGKAEKMESYLKKRYDYGRISVEGYVFWVFELK